ncbi:MAG: hypothetical protein ACNA71_01885 [Kiritimatiellia bacterium]
MILLDVIVLILLIILPPVLLAKRFVRNALAQTAAGAVMLLSAGVLISVLMQFVHVPIRRDTLLLAHGLYLVFAFCLAFPLWRQKKRNHNWRDWLPVLLLPAALIVFPYTRFTGIDTYKWQDLATAIAVEEQIPWLLHPVGLFGFLPRSYPSLQPVLLANIQIMGNLGVDGGFRILSLLIIWAGFVTSRCWFAGFVKRSHADWCALAYVLSPVFMRYSHWATGRGLFLALFPALLCLLTPCATASPPATTRTARNWPRWLGIITTALLLALSHKAAWIALPLVLIASVAYRIIPARWQHRTLALLPFFLAGILISRGMFLPGVPGKTMGAIWLMLSRFAWLLPFGVYTWVFRAKYPVFTRQPLIHFAFLPCILLAFDPQMYGALIALPFIVALAMPLVFSCMDDLPDPAARYVAAMLASILLVSAGAVVMQRSMQAATADVKAVAIFLNEHDPRGPFQIHAPEDIRTRVQAYVTGCPRFALSGTPQIHTSWPAPPPIQNVFSQNTVMQWTAWLRNIVTVQDLDVQWYGNVLRHYHLEVEGRGNIPRNTRLIYQNKTVRLYEE